jgi:hypothetical protein
MQLNYRKKALQQIKSETRLNSYSKTKILVDLGKE